MLIYKFRSHMTEICIVEQQGVNYYLDPSIDL